MVVPRRRNLRALRGEQWSASFIITNKGKPVDLTQQSIVELHLGTAVFTQASGLLLNPASDGSSGTVINEVDVSLSPTATNPLFVAPVVHYFLRCEPLGVPVNGDITITDP